MITTSRMVTYGRITPRVSAHSPTAGSMSFLTRRDTDRAACASADATQLASSRSLRLRLIGGRRAGIESPAGRRRSGLASGHVALCWLVGTIALDGADHARPIGRNSPVANAARPGINNVDRGVGLFCVA